MEENTLDVPEHWAAVIGVPTESSDELLTRLVLLLGNLGGYVFSGFLTVLYLLNGLWLPVLACVLYLAAVPLVYLYYFRTKRLGPTAFLFSTLLFIELVAVHILLGGFQASGLVFVWAAACAIMAIIARQTRPAIVWIFLFLLFTSVLTWYEPVIAAAGPPVAPEVSRLLFALNVGFGLTYMIAASFYFMSLLDQARQRADNLLLNILPAPIARRLKEQPGTIADHHEDVTILFADIAGFTSLCSESKPEQVVDLLNAVFSAFDDLAKKHGLEKVKTVGDAYMVVAGLLEPRADHCAAAAAFGFDLLEAVASRRDWNGRPIRLRVGMSTGPVVAGVIGQHKFAYDLWGDTVNMASRMESDGVVDAIQVTAAVRDRLGDAYQFEERSIQVKGKGEMVTYLIRPAITPATSARRLQIST